MQVRPHIDRQREHNIWHDLMEGFYYVFRLAPLRAIFLLLGLIAFSGFLIGR